ncbi:DUF1330 domain-containing protein [Leifsonia aquatica]|uniref:DUF1330 domain-containing protein n=1 Tax=Leifsonia aquatica TaxID=144185 RepID=UPI00384BEAF5
MTTYLINHLRIPGGVPKEASLQYLENVEATFLPYGGKWLAVDKPIEQIEGAWPDSVILMEFPDMETAKRWYYSPEYQQLLPKRTQWTINDLILTDAVDPGFTTKAYAGKIREMIAATPS